MEAAPNHSSIDGTIEDYVGGAGNHSGVDRLGQIGRSRWPGLADETSSG
jgi:hypothetical protein